MQSRPARSLARASRVAHWIPPCATLVAYVASRLFYAKLGLKLDDSSIDYFMQYLDPVALRSDLLRSVYYQHTQPPLYNLFLGLALQSEHPRAVLWLSGLGFGLALHLGLYALLRRWGVRAWVGVLVVSLFAFNPASILMELWVFYSYPIAAMLIVAAWLLHHGLARERAWALFGAFGLLAAVVLTRSVFHLVWMVLTVALAVGISRRRQRTAVLALLPLALAASLYVKNYVEFGQFTSSTWLGFSLARITTGQLAPAERLDLTRRGMLSDLGGSGPWLPLRDYPTAPRALSPGTPPIPVLTEPTKSTGHPNFNHAAYIEIANTFQRDARAVIDNHPEVWWRATKNAWLIYLAPIHQYGIFEPSRRAGGPRMRAIEQAYEAAAGSPLASWDWSKPAPPIEEQRGWIGAVATFAALGVALAQIARRGRCATSATLAFAVLTIAMVALLGNSVEFGENNRFRFLTEPLAWGLVALSLDRALFILTALARAAHERWTRAAEWSPSRGRELSPTPIHYQDPVRVCLRRPHGGGSHR